MKNRNAYTYGTEGQSGWNHDQMAELLKSFNLFYDPSFDDCDLQQIIEIERETTVNQSC